MFYSIYNYICAMPFVIFLCFYLVFTTLIFVVCLIKNIKRIKNLEKLKDTKSKGQYFILLTFCAITLLVKDCELKTVLGGLCTLLCYNYALNFLGQKIQHVYFNSQNKRENAIDYFDKSQGVMERSKKILSTIKTSTNLEVNEQKEQQADKVNFSHVKSVIKKLQNYSLNQTERRQVEELSFAMYALENGNSSENEKSKLNDGLNSLLKIMAKYSV